VRCAVFPSSRAAASATLAEPSSEGQLGDGVGEPHFGGAFWRGACRLRRLARSASIRARWDGDARRIAEPFVQIGAHFRNQRLDPVLEEVVGAGHDGMLDDGVLLGFQLNQSAR